MVRFIINNLLITYIIYYINILFYCVLIIFEIDTNMLISESFSFKRQNINTESFIINKNPKDYSH